MGKLTLFALFLSVWSPAARAQSSGELVGAVTDPAGAAVPGARVTVTETATGFSRSATSGAEGFYRVSSLRPAEYKIAVEADGFRPVTQEGIVLAAEQKATVNFKLDIGTVTESISIRAAAVQVDTTTGTIRQVVDVDAGFVKIIPVRERLQFQLRAEFFNFFNRVNFNNPVSAVSSGGFGSIRSAGNPRIGQLALKITF